jgi:hypothetical protein
MIRSLDALITRNGNVVRHSIARAETVVRYLHRVQHLAEYQVAYWQSPAPHRVTAEGFLALYEAGRFRPEVRP